MATWTTKTTSDFVAASHINDLQTGKVDSDGTASPTFVTVKPIKGIDNTGIGDGVFDALVGGRYCVGVGFGALEVLVAATQTTAVGYWAGHALISPEGNSFFGYYAGAAITTGYHNTAIGKDALRTGTVNEHCTAVGEGALLTTTGLYNTAVGANAGRLADALNGMTAIGYGAAYHVVDGPNETALGNLALYTNVGWTGGCNTAIGAQTLHTGVNLTGCVALGYSAGYFETGNNKLFIDNVARTNEADGRIKALIYGIFAAASADQRLRINGRLGVTEVPHYDNDAAASAGGLAIGEVYRTDADPPVLCIRVA